MFPQSCKDCTYRNATCGRDTRVPAIRSPIPIVSSSYCEGARKLDKKLCQGCNDLITST